MEYFPDDWEFKAIAPWDLKNLQELSFHYYGKEEDKRTIILENVFRFESRNLKRISLKGKAHTNFRDDFIENISRNYPNLIELEVCCCDLSVILRNMKKLEILKFDCIEDQIMLDTSENLVLPDIRNVEMFSGFRQILSSQFISKLFHFIENTEKLKFSWFDLTAEHLDIVTKKLRKLRVLEFNVLIDREVLQIIQENIEKFNENPRLSKNGSLTLEKHK